MTGSRTARLACELAGREMKSLDVVAGDVAHATLAVMCIGLLVAAAAPAE